MIVDVHAHLGYDRVFDLNFSEEQQWEKMNKFKIDFTILQPGAVHSLIEVMQQHDAIADLCTRYPDKFAGMANPNPHLKDSEYEKEVRRCIEGLGFVGIKLHPQAHGVNPNGRDGVKVFELANELKVPVMMHTGSGIPFANPLNAIPIAKQFPALPIILAHCGMTIMANEAYIAMEMCDNLYGDISWTAGYTIREWTHAIGAHRLMFATDCADNCGTELNKVSNAGLTEEEQQWIFAKSALRIFSLPLST